MSYNCVNNLEEMPLADGSSSDIPVLNLVTPELQLEDFSLSTLLTPAETNEFRLESDPDMEEIFLNKAWDIAFAEEVALEKLSTPKVQVVSNVLIKPPSSQQKPSSTNPKSSTNSSSKRQRTSNQPRKTAPYSGKPAMSPLLKKLMTDNTAKIQKLPCTRRTKAISGGVKTGAQEDVATLNTRPKTPSISSSKRRRSGIVKTNEVILQIQTDNPCQIQSEESSKEEAGSAEIIEPELGVLMGNSLPQTQREWLKDFRNENHKIIMNKTYSLWRSLHKDQARCSREIEETQSSIASLEAELELQMEIIRQANAKIQEKNEHLEMLKLNLQVVRETEATCKVQLDHFKMFNN